MFGRFSRRWKCVSTSRGQQDADSSTSKGREFVQIACVHLSVLQTTIFIVGKRFGSLYDPATEQTIFNPSLALHIEYYTASLLCIYQVVLFYYFNH